MYDVAVPKLTDTELLRRYTFVKPLVDKGKDLCEVTNFTLEDLKETVFLKELPDHQLDKTSSDMFIPLPQLDFECIHRFAHPEFFEPTVAEVLAQIPAEYIPAINAFKIINYPDCEEDWQKNKIVFENHFHISVVRLYSRNDNPLRELLFKEW